MTKVFAICGSLGETSANRAALDVIQRALVDVGCTVVHDHDLAAIPPLNPDAVDGPVEAVVEFRHHIAEADAIVIAAPEYAGSLAGAVKNALDWVVGTGELYRKPVGILSAGTTGGPFAREVLARTLLFQGAHVVAQYGLAAPRTKSNQYGTIVDELTLQELRGFAHSVLTTVGMDDAALEDLSRRVAARVGVTRSQTAPASIAVHAPTAGALCGVCGVAMEAGRVYGDRGMRWLPDGQHRPIFLTFEVEHLKVVNWEGLPAQRCRRCHRIEMQIAD